MCVCALRNTHPPRVLTHSPVPGGLRMTCVPCLSELLPDQGNTPSPRFFSPRVSRKNEPCTGRRAAKVLLGQVTTVWPWCDFPPRDSIPLREEWKQTAFWSSSHCSPALFSSNKVWRTLGGVVSWIARPVVPTQSQSYQGNRSRGVRVDQGSLQEPSHPPGPGAPRSGSPLSCQSWFLPGAMTETQGQQSCAEPAPTCSAIWRKQGHKAMHAFPTHSFSPCGMEQSQAAATHKARVLASGPGYGH